MFFGNSEQLTDIPALWQYRDDGNRDETKQNGKKYEITGFADYAYSDVKLEEWEKQADGIQCRYLFYKIGK